MKWLKAEMTQNNAQLEQNRYTSPFYLLQYPSSHSPVTRQPAIVYDRWGWRGETDESQGAPRHFTFPLLQPDRTWITVNDSPPRPQSDLTCHRLSLCPPAPPPTLMGPRWVAKLPEDPAGRGGQSLWRKRDGGERIKKEAGIGCRSGELCGRHTDFQDNRQWFRKYCSNSNRPTITVYIVIKEYNT